ncbi:hypothetical protein FRB99_002013 [Tulasnella sp. 403]|nr:hypothetical protein FRB99_002013 [Tulasnella sp. 403]
MQVATPEAAQNALETLVDTLKGDPSKDTISLLTEGMDTLDIAVEFLRRCVEIRKCALRKRYNAKLPIHGLPEELFCDILTHVVDAYSDPIVPLLQRLASVSTRWWSTVVSTPRLWTLVHQSDNVALVLRKSARYPLRVVHSADSGTLDFLAVVGQLAERWRSLLSCRGSDGLTVRRGPSLSAYAPYVQRALSVLEELEIVRDDNEAMIPNIEAPRLHHLHLRCLRLSSTTGFTDLSVLKLIKCTGVHLPSFTRMLACSPRLEELDVEWLPRAQMAGEADCMDDLPSFIHLRILRLKGISVPVALHLLRRVQLQDLTKLELVHWFHSPQEFNLFVHHSTRDPMSYHSLIILAFTRPDIRCVKLDLLTPVTQINLLGSRTPNYHLPMPGATENEIELRLYTRAYHEERIADYSLSIAQAITAPLRLRFHSMEWIPNARTLLKLPSLAAMTMVMSPSSPRGVKDLLRNLSLPRKDCNDSPQWFCPLLSLVRVYCSDQLVRKMVGQLARNRWVASNTASAPCLPVEYEYKPDFPDVEMGF